MNVVSTELEGVLIIEPRVFSDRRGWFFENYNRREFVAAGIDAVFVQDNHSKSCARTVRGMHFQAPPHAQAKLVRVVVGEIYDVVVDIRRASTTYGRWHGITLSARDHRMLYVPEGFAHGFCVLSETAEVCYKCSDFYAPETGRGIRWDDPTLGIDWPVAAPILSAQDRAHPLLRDLAPFF